LNVHSTHHKSQSKPPWIIALKSPWIGQEDAAKENHVQWLRQGLGPENLVLDQIFQGDFNGDFMEFNEAAC
jgi:hypothetical protein